MQIRLWLLGFALGSVLGFQPALGQPSIGNIQLPSAPQFPQGQDRVRSADGVECSVSTAPRERFMDIGVVGGTSSGAGVENQYPYILPGSVIAPGNQYNRVSGGVYARIVINLDPERPKIDCNRLYELEIVRLRSEIEQLKLIGVGKAVGGK